MSEAAASAAAEVYTGPAVADGKVIFGDSQGSLYALDAGTGRQRWSVRLGDGIPGRVLLAFGPCLDGGRPARVE